MSLLEQCEFFIADITIIPSGIEFEGLIIDDEFENSCINLYIYYHSDL